MSEGRVVQVQFDLDELRRRLDESQEFADRAGRAAVTVSDVTWVMIRSLADAYESLLAEAAALEQEACR